MAEAPPTRHVCASAALAERGRAVLFEVRHHGERLQAFALRVDGRVVAYLDRCAHLPVEMDWQPGEFLDRDGAFIVCSMHGARYAPASGRCVGGPCGGRGLVAVHVAEVDGEVCWYPSAEIRAVEPDAASGAAGPPAPESTT